MAVGWAAGSHARVSILAWGGRFTGSTSVLSPFLLRADPATIDGTSRWYFAPVLRARKQLRTDVPARARLDALDACRWRRRDPVEHLPREDDDGQGQRDAREGGRVGPPGLGPRKRHEQAAGPASASRKATPAGTSRRLDDSWSCAHASTSPFSDEA